MMILRCHIGNRDMSPEDTPLDNMKCHHKVGQGRALLWRDSSPQRWTGVHMQDLLSTCFAHILQMVHHSNNERSAFLWFSVNLHCFLRGVQPTCKKRLKIINSIGIPEIQSPDKIILAVNEAHCRYTSRSSRVLINQYRKATSSEHGCKPSVHETLYRMDVLQNTCTNRNFSSHLLLAS